MDVSVESCGNAKSGRYQRISVTGDAISHNKPLPPSVLIDTATQAYGRLQQSEACRATSITSNSNCMRLQHLPSLGNTQQPSTKTKSTCLRRTPTSSRLHFQHTKSASGAQVNKSAITAILQNHVVRSASRMAKLSCCQNETCSSTTRLHHL